MMEVAWGVPSGSSERRGRNVCVWVVELGYRELDAWRNLVVVVSPVVVGLWHTARSYESGPLRVALGCGIVLRVALPRSNTITFHGPIQSTLPPATPSHPCCAKWGSCCPTLNGPGGHMSPAQRGKGRVAAPGGETSLLLGMKQGQVSPWYSSRESC